MDTTITARHAAAAYERRTRVRAASQLADRLADGMFAAGGIFLADATFPLNLGLPQGRIGLSLGGALVAGAFAWMKRHAGSVRRSPAPAPVRTELATVYAFRRAA